MAWPMTVLHIALGGAIGAVLRHIFAVSLRFPFATLCVNVLGCFAMGLAFAFLVESSEGKSLDKWVPFVMTGILGGFTTFSAFSLDTLRLVEAGASGKAAVYVVGTVLLCLASVLIGTALGRTLFP